MSSTIGANSGKICIVLKRKTFVDGDCCDVLQNKNNSSSNERPEKKRRRMNKEDDKLAKEKYPIKPTVLLKQKNIGREGIHRPEIQVHPTASIHVDNATCKSMANRCSSFVPSSFASEKKSFASHDRKIPSRAHSLRSHSSSSANSSLSPKRQHHSRSESRQSSSTSTTSSTDFSSASSDGKVQYGRRTRQRHHSRSNESSSSPNMYSRSRSNNSCQSSYNSFNSDESEEEEAISKSSNEEVKNEGDNKLPAAFARARNEDELNGENDEELAEMSDHEMQMTRRRQQLRNKERWQLLKYRLQTAAPPEINHNELEDEEKNKHNEWNEEMEREFVFSLL